MKIIKETTDPKELAFCYATHGIFVNLDRLGTHPTVLELVVLHELYHLAYGPDEGKAWEYAARNLVRINGSFLDLKPIAQFFIDFRKQIGAAYRLVMDTMADEAKEKERTQAWKCED